jgi:hypothetical protein
VLGASAKAPSRRPLLSSSSQPAAADGTCRVAQPYPASVTDKWFPDASTETIPLQMTVTDLARVNAGLPPTSPDVAGSSTVTFSRFVPSGRAGSTGCCSARR